MHVSKPFFGRNVIIRTHENDYLIYLQCIHQPQSYFPPIRPPVHTILDAGAHVGLSALLYAYNYPNARIYAIEPDPENFILLEVNTMNVPNITCINAGLANTRCTLTISDSKKGKCGLVTSRADPHDLLKITGYTVPDLDIFPIDIFKCDIEGAEAEVFDESSLVWLSKVNSIVMEFHQDPSPVLAIIEKLNFTRALPSGEHYILTNRSPV